jgi:hypothetical protein
LDIKVLGLHSHDCSPAEIVSIIRKTIIECCEAQILIRVLSTPQDIMEDSALDGTVALGAATQDDWVNLLDLMDQNDLKGSADFEQSGR